MRAIKELKIATIVVELTPFYRTIRCTGLADVPMPTSAARNGATKSVLITIFGLLI